MIDNDRISGRRKYTCDKCGAIARFKNYDEARKQNWAISYERINCYCPACAPKFRHVGSAGIKTENGSQLKLDV